MHTHSSTHTHTHSHTQGSIHIYCTQHCACIQTIKKALWLMWACRQAIYSLRSMCHLHSGCVSVSLSMCYLPACLCVYLSARKVQVVRFRRLGFFWGGGLSSVKHRFPRREIQTICHFSTYTSFYYSSCIKRVPRLKLPWAQGFSGFVQPPAVAAKATYFNGKPFNSFMQSTCGGYYCWFLWDADFL